MVSRDAPWPRACPECGTSFLSVQGWGVCPSCSLRFGVDSDGNIIVPGRRMGEGVEPRVLVIPDNIDAYTSRLPQAVLDRVATEFSDADYLDVIEMLACYGIETYETSKERIWNTILDRSHGHKHGVRALVLVGKSDPRDLLW